MVRAHERLAIDVMSGRCAATGRPRLNCHDASVRQESPPSRVQRSSRSRRPKSTERTVAAVAALSEPRPGCFVEGRDGHHDFTARVPIAATKPPKKSYAEPVMLRPKTMLDELMREQAGHRRRGVDDDPIRVPLASAI